jgi:hypothetical protein
VQMVLCLFLPPLHRKRNFLSFLSDSHHLGSNQKFENRQYLSTLLPDRPSHQNPIEISTFYHPQNLRSAVLQVSQELKIFTAQSVASMDTTMGINTSPSLLKLLSDLEPLIVKLRYPTEFPRLKDLPPELRIQIWLHAFPPGRHFDLDTYVLFNEMHPKGITFDDHRMPSLLNPDPPVTLFVNRESRQENLRHYCIIFPEGYYLCKSRVNFKIKPLCLNSSKDSLYFDFRTIWTYDISFNWWLQFLNVQIPGGLQKFKALEARNVSWRDTARENRVPGSPQIRPLSQTFSMFTGVRKIIITLNVNESRSPNTESWFWQWEKGDRMPHMPFYMGWYASPLGYTGNDVLRKIFLGIEKCQAIEGKTPNIILRKWQPAARFTESVSLAL